MFESFIFRIERVGRICSSLTTLFIAIVSYSLAGSRSQAVMKLISSHFWRIECRLHRDYGRSAKGEGLFELQIQRTFSLPLSFLTHRDKEVANLFIAVAGHGIAIPDGLFVWLARIFALGL